MCLVHGGAGANILSKSLFAYLAGMSAANIIVGIEEVADECVKAVLEKVGAVVSSYDTHVL